MPGSRGLRGDRQRRAHARAAGLKVVTLHASDAGRPLYERLGFREIGRTGSHAKLQWPALAILNQ